MAPYLASNLKSRTDSPPRSSQLEAEVWKSQDYTDVLTSLGQAVYCFKPDGQLTYWSEMAEELFGFCAEEALDRNIIELLCMESTYETAGHIISRMGLGMMWSGQFPLRKKNGEVFTAAITNSPLFEANGTLSSFIAVCSDARPFKEQLSQMLATDSSRGSSGTLSEAQIDVDGPDSLMEWQQPWRIPFASTLSTLAGRVMQSFGVISTEKSSPSSQEHQTVGIEDSTPPRSLSREEMREMEVPGLPGYFGPPGQGVESVRGSLVIPKSHADFVANFHRLGKAALRKQGADVAKLFGPDSEPAKESVVKVSGNAKASAEGSQKREEGRKSAVTWAEQPVVEEIPPAAVWDEPPTEEGKEGKEGNAGEVAGEWEGLGEWEIPWDALEMKEHIGQGASGTVFKGVWKSEDVAIKVFTEPEYSDATLREFQKEIHIMQRLRHPNVLQFLGAVRTEKHLCIVTEFLPRGSLFRVLHRAGGSVMWPRRLRMALNIACGIQYLHSVTPPVIHRDLKSSNLLVDRSYTVKVADFGLSKLKHATFLTARSGRGTPQWMAPEVLRNEPSDEKSDVYSFAVILWELATLEVPWTGLNPMQVVGAVGFMDKRLPLPPDLDPVITAFIETCWANDPTDRPDFDSIVGQLKAIQKPLTSSSKPNGSR